MKARWLILVGVLVSAAAVAVYTWTQTYEIRMCRSMNGGRGLPSSIDETAPGIHVLQWATPTGERELRGSRPVASGERQYTLTCDPVDQTCSLGWLEDGTSYGRSDCVHPGAATATDYF